MSMKLTTAAEVMKSEQVHLAAIDGVDRAALAQGLTRQGTERVNDYFAANRGQAFPNDGWTRRIVLSPALGKLDADAEALLSHFRGALEAAGFEPRFDIRAVDGVSSLVVELRAKASSPVEAAKPVEPPPMRIADKRQAYVAAHVYGWLGCDVDRAMAITAEITKATAGRDLSFAKKSPGEASELDRALANAIGKMVGVTWAPYQAAGRIFMMLSEPTDGGFFKNASDWVGMIGDSNVPQNRFNDFLAKHFE